MSAPRHEADTKSWKDYYVLFWFSCCASRMCKNLWELRISRGPWASWQMNRRTDKPAKRSGRGAHHSTQQQRGDSQRWPPSAVSLSSHSGHCPLSQDTRCCCVLWWAPDGHALCGYQFQLLQAGETVSLCLSLPTSLSGELHCHENYKSIYIKHFEQYLV